MLRDVNTTVSDGLLGFAKNKGEGVHVKIGASPKTSDVPILITGNMSVSRIRDTLGHCPLADMVMDSVENGSTRIYCIPVAASVAGTCGQVTKQGVGTGTLSVSGNPHNSFDVLIKITGQGGKNEALFMYSLNGGFTFSDELTVPLSGSFTIPEAGVQLTFTESAQPEAGVAFQTGDSFVFATTAPTMTNLDVLTAIDKLRHFNELFEFVHIVGQSQKSCWAAVSEAQRVLAVEHHKPLFFVMEAYVPNENEGVLDYVLRLETDQKAVKNYDIQVVAARSRYIGMDGVTREINNAGIVCGLYSQTRVHQSIGKTRDTAGMGIDKSKMLELTPKCIAEHLPVLDAAKYLTFRQYDGLENFFVTNARVMSPDGSDYRYAEDVRVKNKIIKEVRREGLQLLQDDIDLTNVQGELETRAKFMQAPLDEMVKLGEISSAKITVPSGQDIIATETMQVVIRYVSRGYIREIDIDLGRSGAV